MKTYAKIGIDNEVVQVAVLSDDFSDNAGLQFMKDTTSSENWLICNESVGKGDVWDKSKNEITISEKIKALRNMLCLDKHK